MTANSVLYDKMYLNNLDVCKYRLSCRVQYIKFLSKNKKNKFILDKTWEVLYASKLVDTFCSVNSLMQKIKIFLGTETWRPPSCTSSECPLTRTWVLHWVSGYLSFREKYLWQEGWRSLHPGSSVTLSSLRCFWYPWKCCSDLGCLRKGNIPAAVFS